MTRHGIAKGRHGTFRERSCHTPLTLLFFFSFFVSFLGARQQRHFIETGAFNGGFQYTHRLEAKSIHFDCATMATRIYEYQGGPPRHTRDGKVLHVRPMATHSFRRSGSLNSRLLINQPSIQDEEKPRGKPYIICTHVLYVNAPFSAVHVT